LCERRWLEGVKVKKRGAPSFQGVLILFTIFWGIYNISSGSIYNSCILYTLNKMN